MQMPSKHELPVSCRFPRPTTTLPVALAVLLIVWAVAAALAVQSPPRTTVPTVSESLTEAAASPAEVAYVPATASPDPAVPSVTAKAAPADILSPAAEDPPLTAPEPPLEPAVAPVPAPPAVTEPPAAAAVAPEPPPTPRREEPVGSVPDSNLYVVVAGDTVGTIAARFGLDVSGVLAANGLGAFSTIQPGQTLKLSGPPAGAAAAAPAAVAARPAPAAPVTPAARTIFVYSQKWQPQGGLGTGSIRRS